MEYGLSIGINVKEIEKARLVQAGDKIFLNATVWFKPGETDSYGQHGMITQNVSKEEKDNGVKGHILGNIKCFHTKGDSQQNYQQDNTPEQQNNQPEPDDDIPW